MAQIKFALIQYTRKYFIIPILNTNILLRNLGAFHGFEHTQPCDLTESFLKDLCLLRDERVVFFLSLEATLAEIFTLPWMYMAAHCCDFKISLISIRIN